MTGASWVMLGLEALDLAGKWIELERRRQAGDEITDAEIAAVVQARDKAVARWDAAGENDE